VKAYLSITRLKFAVQLQYRAAAAAAFFTNFFFGFVRVMVFQAFYAFSSLDQPLTMEQAVTYTWLIQVTFRMQPYWGDTEIMQMIRSGNVAYELSRPLNLYFFWYCRLFSSRLMPALLTGIPVYITARFLPGGYALSPPDSAAAGAAWLVSLFLALLLGCAISNLITISALWTIAGDGMQRIFPAAIMVFSGALVPLAFFPDWSQGLLKLLPFSGLMDIPFRFYLGTVPASDILTSGLLQLTWIFIFILAGVWTMNQGTKRVVVQGG